MNDNSPAKPEKHQAPLETEGQASAGQPQNPPVKDQKGEQKKQPGQLY